MSLTNGEIQGSYQFEMLPDQVKVDGYHKDEIRLVLRVGSPACTKDATAVSTTTTTTAQHQLQGTTLIAVMIRGYTMFRDGQLQRASMCTNDTKSYNERFSNTLTIDEKEYLSSRVLHSFFRALASEIPFLFLTDAVTALDQYYSKKKYFEQTLDLYIIKADVGMTIHAAAQKPWDVVKTLILVGEYLESTAKVNQDHNQAGCVYEFITRSYGSKVSFNSCVAIHHHAALAFRNGQDMNKAEEHLVAGWHIVCQNSSGTRDGGGGVDINGDMSTTIFTTILIMYQMISEENASQGKAAGQGGAVDIYALLCGLLYLAGFQARNGGRSHTSVFGVGSEIAQIGVFRGNLDQQSALNILIQAGARPDPNHFRQTILQTKGDDSIAFSDFTGNTFPGKDDAKRNAKTMQRQIKQRNPVDPRHTIEHCYNCGIMERPNGQPNFRCPCHKASYCSKECQARHRKEHKKICTAVAPKKGK